MTTIATDGKTMAGDGLVSGNGLQHMENCQKVFLLKIGSLVGMCGSCFFYEQAIEYLEGEREEIDFGDEFEALILHADGTCECMDGKGRRYKQTVPAVTGSGGAIALGAMAHGATPKQAVKIAASIDISTGGKIYSVRPKA